jgi:queuine tRNA-ribosyltransferase/7-cyano-7-deazaguanine tRNA-ribosyltransferase
MSFFSFTILATDTHARRGLLKTPHGEIQTPCWIPVGTQATVKSLTPEELKEIGAQIVLANTYHLSLRPGAAVVEKMGGLSKFMAWGGPTMTDSGGYQVFSLGSAQEKYNKESKKLNKFSTEESVENALEKERMSKTRRIKPAKIDEEGVTFYSHLDGSERRLDPQISIRMQEEIGADLIVEFDDHESPLWNHEQTKESLERTNRWGLASLKAQTRGDQLMYGVVHGGMFEDLRTESAKFTDTHFPAIAIGGSYSSKETLYNVLDWCTPYFQTDKPRHLLGIAEVADLFEAVERGMDFFDCVAATRRARHGNIYLHPKNGGKKENSFSYLLLKAENQVSQEPLDPGCECVVCQTYTRGYIHHLFKADELLAYRLTTYHNVYFVTKLMEQIREAIESGQFIDLKRDWLGK